MVEDVVAGAGLDSEQAAGDGIASTSVMRSPAGVPSAGAVNQKVSYPGAGIVLRCWTSRIRSSTCWATTTSRT